MREEEKKREREGKREREEGSDLRQQKREGRNWKKMGRKEGKGQADRKGKKGGMNKYRNKRKGKKLRVILMLIQ